MPEALRRAPHVESRSSRRTAARMRSQAWPRVASLDHRRCRGRVKAVSVAGCRHHHRRHRVQESARTPYGEVAAMRCWRSVRVLTLERAQIGPPMPVSLSSVTRDTRRRRPHLCVPHSYAPATEVMATQGSSLGRREREIAPGSTVTRQAVSMLGSFREGRGKTSATKSRTLRTGGTRTVTDSPRPRDAASQNSAARQNFSQSARAFRRRRSDARSRLLKVRPIFRSRAFWQVQSSRCSPAFLVSHLRRFWLELLIQLL
jgi:hypothetical protein